MLFFVICDTPTTTPIPATVLPTGTPGHFKVGVKAATPGHEVQADEAVPSEDTITAQPQKPVHETEPDANTNNNNNILAE